MKISNVSNFMSYKNNSSIVKKDEVVKSKNYDTIQINKNNIINVENNNAFDVEKLKSKIVSEVEAQTNANKIEQIKNQVNNKAYIVNSEELAKIMLQI